jgi:hypothetical protein
LSADNPQASFAGASATVEDRLTLHFQASKTFLNVTALMRFCNKMKGKAFLYNDRAD